MEMEVEEGRGRRRAAPTPRRADKSGPRWRAFRPSGWPPPTGFDCSRNGIPVAALPQASRPGNCQNPALPFPPHITCFSEA